MLQEVSNKYVTKPKFVNAIQFNGDNYEEIRTFTKGKVSIVDGNIILGDKWEYIINPTDYVLEVESGVFMVAYKDTFESNYEKVNS